MTRLKAYYTSASQAVRDASGGSLSVTMHDAFWSPSYWASYDPLSTSTSTPASYAIIDTHQYYAFPPYGNLPQDAILGMVCNMSKLLKGGIVGWDSREQEVQTLPRTVVGEWSLESGSGHSAAASERPSSQEKRTWLRKLFEAQVAAYIPNGDGQPGQGFYYWSCKSSSLFLLYLRAESFPSHRFHEKHIGHASQSGSIPATWHVPSALHRPPDNIHHPKQPPLELSNSRDMLFSS